MPKPTPTVVPIECDLDRERYTQITSNTFHSALEYSQRYVASVGMEHLRGVRLGDELVGGLALLPFGQFFGGRSVPMTGIAAVAIDPAGRACGAASALMRTALEELRANGVPLSALYPATQPVYRRVGYEIAGTQFEISVPIRQIDLRDHGLELRRATEADRVEIEALYRAWAAQHDGNLDRSAWLWDRVRSVRGETMDGHVVRNDGRLEGYVYYVERAGNPFPHQMHVQDIVAVTPAAGRRLLTFLADHRSMCEFAKFTSGPADPLLLLLAEQIAKTTARTAWMLRIVDVVMALELRGYRAGVAAELHLDVRDDVLPENSGKMVLRVADGAGKVETGGRGSFAIDIRGLASLYSGCFSPAQVEGAGYLSAPSDERSIAAALFSGPAPWMRDAF